MLAQLVVIVALSVRVKALNPEQRDVAYKVQNLYQTGPPKGQIVVNDSTEQPSDLEATDTVIGRQGSEHDNSRERIAALAKRSGAKKVTKICDVRDIRRPDGKPARDCTEIYALGGRADGVYVIRPRNAPRSFRVLCELTLDGGWTVIMRRFNGAVDFYRRWADYRKGFGSLNGEHWLGNDYIHWLTSQKNYKMQVDMRYWANKISYYALYDRFSIDAERYKYRLHISGYHGNVGYDGLIPANGKFFSTWDRDNDGDNRHCAQRLRGAFWYTYCHHCSHPTGPYKKCIKWEWQCVEWGCFRTLDQVMMKVKHI